MTTKKIKDYINKGVRHIKHRKGFGVHSPFAYSITTDVIEERNQYYASSAMKRIYAQNAPISFKYACLLLRLANRFRSRQILEVHNDAGYSKECSFFIPDQQSNQEKSGSEYEPDRKRNLTENQKKGETAENEF